MPMVRIAFGMCVAALWLAGCTHSTPPQDESASGAMPQALPKLESPVVDAVAVDDPQYYARAIRRKIERAWIRPPRSKRLQCKIRVRLASGGEVEQVKVIRSSGNVTFDRSVVSAVYEASPLPAPTDARLFEQFRDIEFVFGP